MSRNGLRYYKNSLNVSTYLSVFAKGSCLCCDSSLSHHLTSPRKMASTSSSSSSTRWQSLEQGERENMSPQPEKNGDPGPNEPTGPVATHEEQWLTGFKLFIYLSTQVRYLGKYK
ncbi:hypothetical protein F4813DRAFT_195659 [Daldinia decipiens]|uniref:uncharacterized protein n=1 Tax=Daldinia decipiens TaxID=326647 RepID=UPI0020C28E8D|nr:uncharacterized protein F4813DRAFT_195659 [Daldinia decipiens]KAI1654771.1 hypothetical protein F4813DRAFT_195659 [Daldinia decipiens]